MAPTLHHSNSAILNVLLKHKDFCFYRGTENKPPDQRLFSYNEKHMRKHKLPRYVQEQRIERDVQTIYWFMVFANDPYLFEA